MSGKVLRLVFRGINLLISNQNVIKQNQKYYRHCCVQSLHTALSTNEQKRSKKGNHRKSLSGIAQKEQGHKIKGNSLLTKQERNKINK